MKLVISRNGPLNFVGQMSKIFNSRKFLGEGQRVPYGMHMLGSQAVNESTWIDPI